MPILSNLIVRIGASTDDYDKKVNAALGKAQRFAQSVTAAGEAMAIGFSAPILAAGGAAIKAASDMQSLEMGLKAVMKTTDATTAEMAKLREVAKLPGLGLEEAVRGSVRLQILGNSASESRRIMAELGNALAAVGGGREDFSEVIRQLSQLGAVGKVTKENLDPIVERIPQIAAIIKEKFGAQALGDPAKTFEKMGISSQQFIRILVDELAKGERAGNTYKNSWENIQMAAKDAAAEFGKTLLPMAQRVLDDFLTPGIEKAKAFAQEFQKLPKSTQDWAIGVTAAATAAPLLIVALGAIADKATVLLGAMNKAGISASSFGAAIAGAAIAFKSFEEIQKIIDKLRETAHHYNNLTGAMDTSRAMLAAAREMIGKFADAFPNLSEQIRKAYDAMRNLSSAASLPGFALFKAALDAINTAAAAATGRSKEMDAALAGLAKRTLEQGAQNVKLVADMKNFGGAAGDLIPKINEVGNASAVAAEKITRKAKAHIELKVATLDGAIAQKMAREYMDDYNKAIDKAAELGIKYGGITREQIALNIQVADTLFRYFRILENPPDVKIPGIGGGMKDVPKPPMPVFPGSFEEFRKMGENIGDLGMQTKEQYEAMKRAAQSSARAQSAAMRQVSTVLTDLSRGIARSIIEWKGWGSMLQGVAKSAGEAIIRELVEKALAKLAGKLMDVGGIMGKVFGSGGTGAVMSAVGGGGASAAGGIAGAVGSAGGGAGQAAGAAVSTGLSAAVGMVTGIASAVSGIIGNFQMAGMNKTLDLIEKEVRYSQIHLLNILEKANDFWPWLKAIHERLYEIRAVGVKLEEGGSLSLAGTGGVTIHITGNTFMGGSSQAFAQSVVDAVVKEMKLKGLIK